LPLVAELMLLLPEDCLDHTGVVTLSQCKEQMNTNERRV
jgi:hypothetical protein